MVFLILVFLNVVFPFLETMIGLYLCPRDLGYGRLCGRAMCFSTIFLFDCRVVFFFFFIDRPTQQRQERHRSIIRSLANPTQDRKVSTNRVVNKKKHKIVIVDEDQLFHRIVVVVG